jgi:hypothetical protein
MSLYLALGISIGILIAIWTYIAVGLPDIGFIVWAGIIAWGAFFAAGGGTEGLKKTIAANVSGILWAFLALHAASRFGGGNPAVLALLVGVIAFIMCVQANVPLLSFIPGAFLGAATYVAAITGGAGGGVVSRAIMLVTISMIVGAILGFLSEGLAKRLVARRATATV